MKTMKIMKNRRKIFIKKRKKAEVCGAGLLM